jgi:hypothetical protein
MPVFAIVGARRDARLRRHRAPAIQRSAARHGLRPARAGHLIRDQTKSVLDFLLR